jgi:hypothetical protein
MPPTPAHRSARLTHMCMSNCEWAIHTLQIFAKVLECINTKRLQDRDEMPRCCSFKPAAV